MEKRNNIVRGGQTTMHRFRMFHQILKVAFTIALLFTLIYLTIMCSYKYHVHFKHGDLLHVKSYVGSLIIGSFSYHAGHAHLIDLYGKRVFSQLCEITIPTLEEGLIFFICSFIAVLGYFKFIANNQFNDKVLHGLQIVTPKVLSRMVNKINNKEERRLVKAIKKRNKQRIALHKKLSQLLLKQIQLKHKLKLGIDYQQYQWISRKKLSRKYLNERENLCEHRLFLIKLRKVFSFKINTLKFSRAILVSDYIHITKAIFKLKKEIKDNIVPLEFEHITEKYSLGGIPMPIGAENTHILSIGTTGTGKTVSMNAVVAKIRLQNGKAVIYDKMGTFVEKFYDPKKDIILNPFDERSPAWSIFDEVEKNTDWDMIAEAMIAQSGDSGDPFWVNAARTLLSSTGKALQEKGEHRTSELVDKLLKVDLGVLAEMVKNLPAASIISSEDKENKTALSVRAILSTNLACLQFLKEDQKTWINLREWIRNDSKKGILFFTSRGDLHASIQGLITMWLEILINTLLSLPKKEGRKLWFILDELPSLKKIPSLTSALAESRQYGGAFFIATQTWSQMESTYGQKHASSIAGVTRSRFILGSSDEVSAKWSSDNIGEIVIKRHKENISYGANSSRDGISNSEEEHKERLVTSTEIRQLRNLEGYVIYPNGLPPAKVMQVYKSYARLNKGFVPVADFFINKEKLLEEVNDANSMGNILDFMNSDEVSHEDESQETKETQEVEETQEVQEIHEISESSDDNSNDDDHTIDDENLSNYDDDEDTSEDDTSEDDTSEDDTSEEVSEGKSTNVF